MFLNFSANFGMLSENLRQQLASNHQHLKQLQDTIRTSIASRSDAAGFSDAVDHFDSMSVRGSECSSVGGRRTPTQVTSDCAVLLARCSSDSKMQESLPDAAKTMQLECSALASVGEGGNWQYLEGDVSGVRRYELLTPERLQNSTFSSSSAASQSSFANSLLSNHSVIADGNVFTGDVYCVKGVATVPAASTVVFDKLMGLDDAAIKLWDALFFGAQLDANPPPLVGQGSQALTICVSSSPAGGAPVVLSYLRSWKQQRDGTMVLCLKRLDARASTLSLPMRGYVIAPLDSELSLVSTITAADLSIHATEADASHIKTEIVDSVTSIARLRSLLSLGANAAARPHEAASAPSAAIMSPPAHVHLVSALASGPSSPFARAAQVRTPTCFPPASSSFLLFPNASFTTESAHALISDACVSRLNPVQRPGRYARRAQLLEQRGIICSNATATEFHSLLARICQHHRRRRSVCLQNGSARAGAAH